MAPIPPSGTSPQSAPQVPKQPSARPAKTQPPEETSRVTSSIFISPIDPSGFNESCKSIKAFGKGVWSSITDGFKAIGKSFYENPAESAAATVVVGGLGIGTVWLAGTATFGLPVVILLGAGSIAVGGYMLLTDSGPEMAENIQQLQNATTREDELKAIQAMGKTSPVLLLDGASVALPASIPIRHGKQTITAVNALRQSQWFKQLGLRFPLYTFDIDAGRALLHDDDTSGQPDVIQLNPITITGGSTASASPEDPGQSP